jgi:taurine dioxygenase
MWANTVTAYQSLPTGLRDLAGQLRVIHSNDHDWASVYSRSERADAAVKTAERQFASTVYETEHPAVRVHPETAERALLLGGFARTVMDFFDAGLT